MFYPDLSPMSVKWHLMQNNSSAASRILNCSSAAAAISNLDIFGGHSHQQHYNGLHVHAHQRYNMHGNANGSDKQFDQFGKLKLNNIDKFIYQTCMFLLIIRIINRNKATVN